jgi:hypothetical protein
MTSPEFELLLLSTAATSCACGRRRLNIDTRWRERPVLELPALRRLHVLVVVAATERDAARVSVLTDVNDDGVFLADRAAGAGSIT